MAGVGISGAQIMITLAIQVISVPVLLSFWGAQMYGEWLVLTSLVASLSILNLGVQTYATNRMIASYVRGELEEGTRILHAAIRLYAVLCTLALAAAILLIAWPQLLQWLQIKAIPALHARVILAIQGLLAVYAILGGLLLGLLKVVKQYPRQLTYGLIERLVILGSPILIVVVGGLPLHASIMMGVLMAAVACIALRDVWHRSPFSIGYAQSSWRDAQALIFPSLSFFGVSLASTLLSSGMIIVISKASGAIAVAVFTTTLMLTNLVRTMVFQGLNVLWPEITAIAAKPETFERLREWHRLVLKLTAALIVLGGAGIAILGPDILAIWTRGKIEVDAGLNLLLVIYLLVQAPALVSGVFGLAINRQEELLAIHIVGALFALAAAWFLLPALGVRGAALALILGQAVHSLWILASASRWFSDSLLDLLGDFAFKGGPLLGVVALGGGASWSLASGFYGKILAFTAIVFGATFLTWKTWLTAAQREMLASIFHQAFPRLLRHRQVERSSV